MNGSGAGGGMGGVGRHIGWRQFRRAVWRAVWRGLLRRLWPEGGDGDAAWSASQGKCLRPPSSRTGGEAGGLRAAAICIWVAGFLLAHPVSGAEGARFRVADARDAQQVFEGGGRQSLAQGHHLHASWRVRTGPAGLLLLIGAGARLEFQGLSQTRHGATLNTGEPSPLRSFLKPGSAETPARAADSVFDLDQGTLLAEVGFQPLSLSCPLLQIDARHAVFALTTHPASGALVSVLKGQIKIRFADKSVTFLNAGKSLRAASGVPPKLTLLEETGEVGEHKRGLTRLCLGAVSDSGDAGVENPGSVGAGAEARFDLSQRRRAALLTAPNPGNVGQPEVSPELPPAQTSTP